VLCTHRSERKVLSLLVTLLFETVFFSFCSKVVATYPSCVWLFERNDTVLYGGLQQGNSCVMLFSIQSTSGRGVNGLLEDA